MQPSPAKNLEEVLSQSPGSADSQRATLGALSKKYSNLEEVVAASRDMPQALSAVYVHLVFSTKERRPLLRAREDRDALHHFLGRASRELDCPPILVGGVEDHVHILARFSRTISQADWVKELKRVSNRWLKERSREYADFEWQGGYAVFSVSASNLEKVKEYIANQEEHHRKMNFQDELRALLKKHAVEWDERYLWD